MVDPYLLLLLSVSFFVVMLIAMIRQHWVEFGVCLLVFFFSTFSLVAVLVS